MLCAQYMPGAAINIATATLNQFHPFVCRSCITIQEKSWYLCTLSVRRFVFYLTVSALARFWQFLVRSFVSPSVILSLLCFSCFLEYRSEEKRAELPPNAKKTTSVGTIIFVKYQVSTTRIDEIIFKNKQWYISSFSAASCFRLTIIFFLLVYPTFWCQFSPQFLVTKKNTLACISFVINKPNNYLITLTVK